MKEVRYFYVPNAATEHELPEEEAQHAVRVLRMETGDEMMLMDGCGTFYRAHVSESSKKRCLYTIDETLPQMRQWPGHLHLAMAPTKNMDRTEWTCEKATEIGFDELTFLRCKFSERTVIKTERVDKILISATKQSRKAWKPILNEMIDFKRFIEEINNPDSKLFTHHPKNKFICHCYDEPDLGSKLLLKDCLKAGEDALVLVGPEGDFSIDEVRMAEAAGFQSVSLGNSRLRTETAALVAVHLMNLEN
ncbi:MAG: 16S rRNA (uracil(1498)-N(3))-methyltransferase [Bacteroidaceae bacterium]|nr:16S rRNA (uracil(1498)-N(3))-methyltransferase [Bacteroidaceae bacterium]